MHRLYLVRQNTRDAAHLELWISEAWTLVREDAAWNDWQLSITIADAQNSFRVTDVFSQVAETSGPTLLVGSLKQAAVALLQERLLYTFTVRHCDHPEDSADIYDAMLSTLTQHADGEPEIPERLAVALLLLNKFEKAKAWGGDAKNKAYLWAYDLAKGRGVDDQFSAIAPEVANQLALKGLLKTKKSQGKTKYALNPNMRREIYRLLESQQTDDEGLRKYLFGGRNVISTRVLDGLVWK